MSKRKPKSERAGIPPSPDDWNDCETTHAPSLKPLELCLPYGSHGQRVIEEGVKVDGVWYIKALEEPQWWKFKAKKTSAE